MHSASFVSYNPTGLHELKCKWISDLSETLDADYICVQEHMRMSRTIDKYFSEQFTKYNSYVIPGFREVNQTRGRPMAGIAQLSKKSLSIRKDRVMTKNPRIQAQILNFEHSKLLWVNSYLPNDPLTVDFDESELLEVLNDIERILDNSEYDDVLWCGDIN